MLLGKDRGCILLINRRANRYTIDQIDMIDSNESVAFVLTGAVQLTHRTDLSLSAAMQDTERCERIEIPAEQAGSLTLPAYSFTRMEFDISR